MPALRVQIPQVLEYAPVDYAAMPYEYAVVDSSVEYVEVEENATGAELMTGVGYRIASMHRQTLDDSFWAASTPIFATRYSFFSIYRDLQGLHIFAPLQSQKQNQTFVKMFGGVFGEFFMKERKNKRAYTSYIL